MTVRITLTAPSMDLQWEVFDWHHNSNVPYYPSIDPRNNVAHYDFEDRDEAMRFKLTFGGTTIERDNL